MRKFLIKFWRAFKAPFLKFLKSKVVKIALKKILGATAMGGFRAWLVAFILEELYESIAEPIIQNALNYWGYTLVKKDGEKLVRKLNDAEKNQAKDKYRRTIRDILS